MFTAFGMTKRSGRSAENDPGLASMINADAPSACVVGKSWDFHVDLALGISNEENLENISESVKFLAQNKEEVHFDAEHFFDGYKSNPDYALDCLITAFESGARWVVLCDTNGGTLPHEVERIVLEVCKKIPGKNIGIHAHNDTGNAVANSLAAVRAGARQVQGTINGLGERCGNANLVSIIPTFALKREFNENYELSISKNKIDKLTELSRLLDEILNRVPDRSAPYVGSSAFAHKGGLHVSAVNKDPKTYEHIEPELVGNSRQIIVSEQSGKSNILSKLKSAGIQVDEDDKTIQKILDRVKDREFIGYSYDGADASFEILVKKVLGEMPSFFEVKNFNVNVKNSGEEGNTLSHAEVRLIFNGKELELKTLSGSVGPSVIDIRTLYNDLGIFTYDPGYGSTGSCESAITYIDGEEGILLHRGYPIDQLANKSSFLVVVYLLLNGELPKKPEEYKQSSFDLTNFQLYDWEK